LRAWIAQYPEEREWMRDGFEQLAQMEEAAEAQAAEKHSELQPAPGT
jgi:hypothetical protein